jgi:uncharacterized NAD-dependent epimerase/dehydratase family protein
MSVALLAHDKFPDGAKTTVGILRYGDQDVAAVLDRATAGSRVHDFLSDVQDAPIVDSMDAVDTNVDELIIGIAPIGGGFDESWRSDVRTALKRGVDVTAGLHYFLNDDGEFVELADEYGCELWDVRKPPADLTVADGVADQVDAEIIQTVGTDCNTGKMTTTMELYHGALDAGLDAGFIPTGQTGIMIEGWGNPIDRVISDFTAGAVEEMILERGDDHDYLFVEGQGSTIHPAYSGVTLSILHGAMPDHLVLCHIDGRETIHEYEHVPIPSPEVYVNLYESLAEPVADTTVVGGSIATHRIESNQEANARIEQYADAIGAPAVDPVRFDVGALLERLR